ncbi:hypothetical protein [uncultured Paraglaciecola sp.]|uniref:hypothetical protein n=1 Tax=uncultured Paraglaciecola sp. TaxID=1765024 RepID=UPI0030DD626C|tara:strand:+ start:38963 stop:39439 length:477 start_codon:yes stop_codon:yes gene_type:complete
MKNTLITACIVGLVASIAFILVQPLFGLATLTSRHAAAYINLGGYSDIAALLLSWFVHISVSIFYALLATGIFTINHSMIVSVAQVIILGWFTTLIATPANEWVVKLVTTQQFPDLSSLAALNTQIGPKLWLHILFFAFVLGGLFIIKRLRAAQESKS